MENTAILLKLYFYLGWFIGLVLAHFMEGSAPLRELKVGVGCRQAGAIQELTNCHTFPGKER